MKNQIKYAQHTENLIAFARERNEPFDKPLVDVKSRIKNYKDNVKLRSVRLQISF